MKQNQPVILTKAEIDALANVAMIAIVQLERADKPTGDLKRAIGKVQQSQRREIEIPTEDQHRAECAECWRRVAKE
jgi:hypothetical protein